MFSVIRKTLGISLLIIFVLAILTSAGIYFWWNTNTAPVSQTKKDTQFEVVSGDTVSSVAQSLESQGIIKSAFHFRIWHQLSGDEIKLQRGSYTVSPSMTYTELANALSKDKPQTVSVTLREGARVEEYAEKLSAVLDSGSFKVADFMKLAKPLEGYLFPDTYEFYKNESAKNVINALSDNFENRYQSAKGPTDASEKQEIITIASLIEREGINAADRRMISGIIRNRLEIGMALQIDATLQYVRDSQRSPNTWWASPDPALKELDSPYNTYKYPGLPPAPISNPSLDSIRAAIEPTENSNLYYLHSNGEAYYARTFEQHQVNINRYLN